MRLKVRLDQEGEKDHRAAVSSWRDYLCDSTWSGMAFLFPFSSEVRKD